MQRCPMENIILQVKLLEEPLSLLSMAIQPPELSGITNAIENLRDAGGLTSPPGSLHSVRSSRNLHYYHHHHYYHHTIIFIIKLELKIIINDHKRCYHWMKKIIVGR